MKNGIHFSPPDANVAPAMASSQAIAIPER